MAITSRDPQAGVGSRIGGRRQLGQRGEEAVADWYSAAGYEIAARNWRCRDGEIDLVLVDPDGVLVICEVKTRTSTAYGTPEEAVTATKRLRLRRLAARWLAASRTRGAGMRTVRFDVAGVMADGSGRLRVEVIHDAF
jgi:putative endonuclease